MIRVTTSGTLKSYRYNLNQSITNLNDSMNTVLTQRSFNTFAEDPAAASKSFQLRRSYERINSQLDVSSSTIGKYQSAYTALENVVNVVDNEKDGSAFAAVLSAANDPTGSGRIALGQSLTQLADGIVQTMNSKYADDFIFAGADGHNVPFSWQKNSDGSRTLLYREIDVNIAEPPKIELDADENPIGYIYNETTDEIIAPTEDQPATHYKTTDGEFITIADYDAQAAEYAKLKYLADETRYVDIGIGLQEDDSGEIIESSAFNNSLTGINFLGYGSDEEGDSLNIASIINEMGEILKRCDATTGQWDSGTDQMNFMRLAEKFDNIASNLKEQHTSLSAEANFLNDNKLQLENTAYALNEQIADLEDVDLADAITSFSYAKYCYDAALASGNHILSSTLMDYLN